ncbi:MAG: DUF4349 domain-containing protein [Armatimonadota bacterium]
MRVKIFTVAAVVAALLVIVALVLPMFSKAREKARWGGDRTIPAAYAPSMPADEALKSLTGGALVLASDERMVIKSANLSLEVRDADGAVRETTAIATRFGGYITESRLDKAGDTRQASIVMRVPAASYAKALDAASKLGKVLSKDEEGEDVTEEFVDLDSRLRNLRREEEAFLGVLAKARSVKDILAVEAELARVRGEIERVTGRMKYLKNMVALSTINIALSEPAPMVTQTVSWDLARTGKGAANALLLVLRSLASLAVWVAVFLPVWAVPLGIVVYRRRRGASAVNPA